LVRNYAGQLLYTDRDVGRGAFRGGEKGEIAPAANF